MPGIPQDGRSAQIEDALKELRAVAAGTPEGEEDAAAREAFAQLARELERLNENILALGRTLGDDANQANNR